MSSMFDEENGILDTQVEESVFQEKPEISNEAQSKLLKVSALCVVFMIAEVIGGYISNSVAIMSDAAHLLSDLMSFFVGIYSIRLTMRRENNKFPFGFGRAETVGAFLSVVLVWIITLWLVYEAVLRLLSPPENFDAKTMLITSIIGVCCNVIMGCTLHDGPGHHHHGHDHDHDHDHDHGHSHGNEHKKHAHSGKCSHSQKPSDNIELTNLNGTKLHNKEHNDTHDHDHDKDHDHKHGSHSDHDHSHHKDHNSDEEDHHDHDHDDHDHDHDDEDEGHDEHDHENMNVRAAMIHVIGDLIQSIAVVIIAVILFYNPNLQFLDPVLTFLFSGIVVYTTVPLSKKCILILMSASPSEKDYDKIKNSLSKVKGVSSVYDFKLWELSRGKVILTAKVKASGSSQSAILSKLQKVAKKNRVKHATFQVEIAGQDGSTPQPHVHKKETNGVNGTHSSHSKCNGHSHHNHNH